MRQFAGGARRARAHMDGPQPARVFRHRAGRHLRYAGALASSPNASPQEGPHDWLEMVRTWPAAGRLGAYGRSPAHAGRDLRAGAAGRLCLGDAGQAAGAGRWPPRSHGADADAAGRRDGGAARPRGLRVLPRGREQDFPGGRRGRGACRPGRHRRRWRRAADRPHGNLRAAGLAQRNGRRAVAIGAASGLAEIGGARVP